MGLLSNWKLRRFILLFVGSWLLLVLHTCSHLFRYEEEQAAQYHHQHDIIPPQQRKMLSPQQLAEVSAMRRNRHMKKDERVAPTHHVPTDRTRSNNTSNNDTTSNFDEAYRRSSVEEDAIPHHFQYGGMPNIRGSNAVAKHVKNRKDNLMRLLPKKRKPYASIIPNLKDIGLDDEEDLDVDSSQGGSFFGSFRTKHRVFKNVTLLLPKPVIVMGFPKAGTSSIFSFFQEQGLRSQHWYCCRPQFDPQEAPTETRLLMSSCMIHNLGRGAPIFTGCGVRKHLDILAEVNGPRKEVIRREGKHFLMDDGTLSMGGPGRRIFFPQHFRIREIHEHFPNATWILNTRPVDQWVNSVMKWGDDLDKQFANEYYMQNASHTLPRNETEMRHFLQTIFVEHNDMVRRFVHNHTSHALVEIDISNETSGSILAEAFGLKSDRWTHKNKNRKHEQIWILSSSRLLHDFRYVSFVGSGLWWWLLLFTLGYLGWYIGMQFPF